MSSFSLDRIRWLVLDVDGTLTDGKVYYSTTGERLKRFDMRDGKGVGWCERSACACS